MQSAVAAQIKYHFSVDSLDRRVTAGFAARTVTGAASSPVAVSHMLAQGPYMANILEDNIYAVLQYVRSVSDPLYSRCLLGRWFRIRRTERR